MKIPDRVKILYKDYTVERVENLHDGAAELYGQISYIPETIQLNAGASEEQQAATLFHEVVHGLDDVYGIGLKEKQVAKLGTALYVLFRDNPALFQRDAHD